MKCVPFLREGGKEERREGRGGEGREGGREGGGEGQCTLHLTSSSQRCYIRGHHCATRERNCLAE